MFGMHHFQKIIFILSFMVNQQYYKVQNDPKISFYVHRSRLQRHVIPLIPAFSVFLQILGLVFSMTMFCQAVKVETFYA